MVIQLRSLATLSHRRSLALVGRAGLGPNTNSNEVLGVEDKFRVGGELELIFFVDIYFSFLGVSLEDDLFLNFHGGL